MAARMPNPEDASAGREREREMLREIGRRARAMADPSIGALDPAERGARMARIVETVIRDRYPMLAGAERHRVLTRVLDLLLNLGPLEPLLAEEAVTDITVNGIEDIWVDRGNGLEYTDLWFVDEQELAQVIDRLLRTVHRRVDESNPMVDARLPSGERVNAVIAPASVAGTSLTIRRFQRAYSPEELAARGTFDRPILDLLGACVRARANVLISGGAGTGKTTLLNALTTFIPENERLVSIEDISELGLYRRRRNVVALEARPPSGEGTGEIDIRALVRNALRMRPDRIIVGEVRGAETLDMLQAMNTGHEGSITTVHANSPEDSVPRLLTLAAMTDLGLSWEALQAQVRSAIDVIIQLSRGRDERRRVVQIAGVSDDGEGVTLEPVARYSSTGDAFEHSRLPERLRRRLAAAGEDVPDAFGG